MCYAAFKEVKANRVAHAILLTSSSAIVANTFSFCEGKVEFILMIEVQTLTVSFLLC